MCGIEDMKDEFDIVRFEAAYHSELVIGPGNSMIGLKLSASSKEGMTWLDWT